MEQHTNSWETLSTRVIYDNPWITLKEDQVLNPAGKRGIYGKVLFKNRAVGIIPLDTHGNTWLVGQYRYTLNQYSWEIPMGGVPPAEDILSGAKRELVEETGIQASRWIPIMKLHTSNCVTDEEGYVYLAEELTHGPTDFDDTEQIEIRKLPFSEALEMVMKGKITDAISTAGILMLARIRSLH